MDTIFKDEEWCVWYMDDILIYGGTTEAEHRAFVEKVLQQRVNPALAVNRTKSEFHGYETIFLFTSAIAAKYKWIQPNSKP